MITEKDLGKIKRIYTGENGEVERVGVIVHYDEKYSHAKILETSGEISGFNPKNVKKSTFAKNINSDIREKLEEIGTTIKANSKKIDKLDAEIEKLKKERHKLNVESVDLLDKSKFSVENLYNKENDLISRNDADEMISKALKSYANRMMTVDDFNAHRIEFNGINEIRNDIEISIPLKSIRHAKEGDFGGLIFFEYDNSTHVYDDEKTLNRQADIYLSQKGYSLKDLIATADKLSNKKVDIKVSPFLSVGDKTSTLYIDIEFGLNKFKRDKKSVDEIVKAIKELFV